MHSSSRKFRRIASYLAAAWCGCCASAHADSASARCLDDGGGYFRARLAGSINAELDWKNADTDCTGARRPNGGVRVRFSHAFGKKGERLVFLFGIPTLREGRDARNLPVNLTVIREGAAEFYGTVGDDKCSIDSLQQHAIAGIPLRNRSYRIVARGFCIQPAPAVNGKGAVLLTRFDFAGRIDFNEEDDSEPLPTKPT